ncbi:3-hydroxybutyrate dehydrogenase [Tenuibacillus multivorans]|uniref:3-hydroxybutyrate dehydrogenase n=1 Tax=Tenuibacillus multivorans TaxID=237069 RepID=A0A1G9WDH0_9BACI|nr:3-hydroxybutyrate dehydrogenase [Tenuibacillus multivorans]GEL76416.1 3-hydroxybutyrate dehydrogenase [Tenuibacillus multivorans]SDM82624.1 3-hydroxybutyrate dehydrogenase [Tenuibacillus multivorans]
MERAVVVTGAAQGIGYAIAKAFIKNGDFVMICDLDLVKAQEAASSLGQAKAFKVDVSDEYEVDQFVQQVIDERGQIDVLVNNAGLQHIDQVENFPVGKWRQLIEVMLTGPFLMTKFTLPHMKKRQYGRIINISSVHGKSASPYKSAYISAKHGVVGLTRTVAIETANDGITVNAIMPGAVRTKLIENQLAKLAEEDGTSEQEALHNNLLIKQPMKRLLEPEDIAHTAVFLASDGAGAITGETVSVSGGW